MAGSSATVTFGKVDVPYVDTYGIVTVTIDWVADNGTGAVPDAVFDTTDMVDILGRCATLAITNPGAAIAPQDNYDITIVDDLGCDIYGGALTNRDTALSEQTAPIFEAPAAFARTRRRPIISTGLTFKLANNNVNSATGTCILCFEVL
jgi:hypothetical protein